MPATLHDFGLPATTPSPAGVWRSWRPWAVPIAVGLLIRLVWVLWATEMPFEYWNDGVHHLRMAVDFASWRTPSIDGEPTAYFPPGFAMTLAPFVWVQQKVGWGSPAVVASTVNLVAGTATIVATASLARQWLGERTALVAAWLMALAPGHVVITSLASPQTMFVLAVVATLVAATALQRPSKRRVTFLWFGLGVLVGYATLLRPVGAILVAAPLLVARGASRWRSDARPPVMRPTVLILTGMAALLAPWTIRNGVEVGLWSPLSTNTAALTCAGHSDGSTGTTESGLIVEATDCLDASLFAREELFGRSVADRVAPQDRDEATWFGTRLGDAASWAVRHPLREIGLTAAKTFETFRNDEDSLAAVEDQGRRTFIGGRKTDLLVTAGEIWLAVVIAFSALGLMLLRSARRAVPVWGTAALLLVTVWAGIGTGAAHQPITALLSILAAALVAGFLERPRRNDDGYAAGRTG